MPAGDAPAEGAGVELHCCVQVGINTQAEDAGLDTHRPRDMHLSRRQALAGEIVLQSADIEGDSSFELLRVAGDSHQIIGLGAVGSIGVRADHRCRARRVAADEHICEVRLCHAGGRLVANEAADEQRKNGKDNENGKRHEPPARQPAPGVGCGRGQRVNGCIRSISRVHAYRSPFASTVYLLCLSADQRMLLERTSSDLFLAGSGRSDRRCQDTVTPWIDKSPRGA